MPLSKNKRIRNGHRTFVTKTIQGINEFLDDFDASLSNTEKLRGWRITLDEKKNILNKLDEAIINEIAVEKIDEEINEASEFAEGINRTTAKIDIALEAILKRKTEDASQVRTNNPSSLTSNVDPSNIVSTNHDLTPKLQARLPKLTLARFSGEPTKWQSFWDSFESAVHNNKSISSVDKFNYLKGLLDGSAASAITGLSLTGENYETAVDILKKRFANPQLLISSHMDALLKLHSSTSSTDIKSTRRLYDTIESHIRSLQNLGVESKSYGSLLVPVIMSKIPEEMRLIVSRKFDQNTWDIDGMLEAFKTELEARERCFHMRSSSREEPPKRHNTGIKQDSTTSALFVDNRKKEFDPTTVTCTYCQGQHLSARCNIVSNVAARREILRRKGKCFNCLRSAHIVRTRMPIQE